MKLLYCAAIALVVGCLAAVPTIEWPKVGYVEFQHSTPYENSLNMPFTVNFDYDRGFLKVSAYDDLTYTIYHFNDNKPAKGMYVFAYIDEEKCMDFANAEGDPNAEVEIPSYFPDLNDGTWELDTEKVVVEGRQCDRWFKNTEHGSFEFFMIIAQGSANHIPVKWVSRARDPVFNSHTDVYEMRYTTYKPGFTETNFEVYPSVCNNPLTTEDITTYMTHSPYTSEHIALFGKHDFKKNSEEVEDYEFDADFESWCNHHGKTYSSLAEKMRRESIFISRRNMVLAHENDQSKTFKMTLNHHADLSVEEVLKSKGGHVRNEEVISEIRKNSQNIHEIISDEEVPESIDWRVDGVLPPVGDQNQCGSCWLWSASCTIGSRYALKHRTEKDSAFIDVSVQGYLDCFKMMGGREGKSLGCYGGSKEELFLHMEKTHLGVAFTNEYPYISVDGYCQKEKFHNDSRYTVAKTHMIDVGDEDGLMKALMSGPLSISIAVPEDLLFYRFGIYDNPESANMSTGHDVVLTGAGVSLDGTPYWIVRNSWSSHWGNNGYFYVKRGENQLNITGAASYVELNE